MGGEGGMQFFLSLLFVHFFCWSIFRGGGKGSDEEHITYSGGKEIFDLLRCGWKEKDERRKKRENENNHNVVKLIKYDKMKILCFTINMIKI